MQSLKPASVVEVASGIEARGVTEAFCSPGLNMMSVHVIDQLATPLPTTPLGIFHALG